jgi:hypothetical protein
VASAAAVADAHSGMAAAAPVASSAVTGSSAAVLQRPLSAAQVTITPTASPGTAVVGNLYIDDFVPATQDAGSELLAVPNAYTVGS